MINLINKGIADIKEVCFWAYYLVKVLLPIIDQWITTFL